MPTSVLEYDLIQKRRKLGDEKVVGWGLIVTVLVFTLAATAAELVLAQITHCISLLVLSYQNIYNVLTLLMTLVSRTKGSNLAGCKGGDSGLGNTFGWRRMEVVGSIGSLVFLFSLCFATFIEALQTIFHNEHLDTMHHADWIMIALGGQVAVWGLAYLAIGGYSHHQARAVREDTLGTQVANIGRDLLGVLFTFTICSAIYFKMIVAEYSNYIDPVMSMVYILTLIWTCVPLVRASCLILLQTIPGNVDVTLLKQFILQKFPGILALHEVHVWTLTPSDMVLTAHITYQNRNVYTEIHTQVETFFNSQGFSKITIQPEFPESENLTRQDSPRCTLTCPHGANCTEKSCCNEEQNHPEEECCQHSEGEHSESAEVNLFRIWCWRPSNKEAATFLE